tara:strand:- start:736 stop:3684 length:2949 start_codon:yes stop_codon:yes gene_type:complete
MPKRKYTPGGERRSFKRLGEGLRASESRIQEQQQISTDALKLQALRAEKLDNQFISGIGDKQRFEQGVLREKQELENKARTRKFEAFQKFADTDVARMEGEAKALKEKADFWKEFAPKFAENLGKLAEGSLRGIDKIKGQGELRRLKEEGYFDLLTDNAAASNFKLGNKVNFDQFKLDPDSANGLHDRTWKVSSHWASKRLAHWFKQNKELIKSDFEASFSYGTSTEKDKEGRPIPNPITKENANEAYEFNAYLLLDKLGISPNSEGGREIMNLAESWGHQATKQFVLKEKVRLTSERLTPLFKNFESIDIFAPKTDIKPSGADQAKSVLEQIELILRDGHFQLENSIVGPNETMFDLPGMRYGGIEYLVDNDQSMTTEKLDILLDLSIRDTGKEHPNELVAYSKKFPDKAIDLHEKLNKKQTARITALNNERESKGLIEVNELKKSIENQEWLLDAKGDIRTDLEPGQEEVLKAKWWNTKINHIHNSEVLTEKTRPLAYVLFDFNPQNHKIAGVHSLIKGDLLDGKLELAIKRYNNLSKPDQQALSKDIEIFSKLQEAGYTFDNGKHIGMKAVIERNTSILKGAQKATIWGGNSLGENATQKLAQMNVKWLDQFNTYLAKNPDDVLAAAELADAWMLNEFKEGKDQEGHWLQRKDGTKKGSKVTFNDIEDEYSKNLSILNAMQNIEDVKKSEEIDTISGVSFAFALRNPTDAARIFDGYDGSNPYDLLNREDVVSTKELLVLANQLNNQMNSESKGALGDFKIPDNLHIFQEIVRDKKVVIVDGETKETFEQPPLQHVVLAALEKRNEKITGFPNLIGRLKADKNALIALKNDRKGYKNINKLGTEKYNDAVASTGIVPKRFRNEDLQAYMNKEIDIMDLFSKTTGVKFVKTENADGSFSYSFDSEDSIRKYLYNGGLNLKNEMTPSRFLHASGFPALLSNRVLRKKKHDDFWNPILNFNRTEVELPEPFPGKGNINALPN